MRTWVATTLMKKILHGKLKQAKDDGEKYEVRSQLSGAFYVELGRPNKKDYPR